MSVLIRGMEMPAKCKDCDLVDDYQMQCPLMPGVVSLYKEFTDAIQENRRSKYCPLIPVPNHGRLKDYDVIYAEYKTWFDNAEYRDYKSMFYALWNAFNCARVIVSADKDGEG